MSQILSYSYRANNLLIGKNWLVTRVYDSGNKTISHARRSNGIKYEERIAGERFNSDMRKIEKLSCNSDTGEISSKKMSLGYFLKSSRLIVSIP